ncbi:MAG: hypothetical protein H0W08_21360 [Acidobacteria bacterium]|nr:hypothetical protein [Acidobacteriota bacterium]
MAARQSIELTVSASPGLENMAAPVREIEPALLAASLSRAGLALPSRVEIALIGSGDPRARGVPDWVVARAFGTDTIVIYAQRVPSYPYDSFESVVRHEIVHLALNARAGGRPLPRWFHEGVAVSVESAWGLGSQARLLLASARDPGLDDVAMLFAADAAPETTTAYLLSAALIEDVRRRHGLVIPGAIAGRVAQGAAFEVAFRVETGESLDQAAAHAWRVYRGLRWLPIATGGAGLWGWILVLAVIAFAVRLRRRRQKRWDDDEEGGPVESGR